VFAGSEDTTETTEENSGNWPNPLMCDSAAASCCWFFEGMLAIRLQIGGARLDGRICD
jgi:hypothetical protein